MINDTAPDLSFKEIYDWLNEGCEYEIVNSDGSVSIFKDVAFSDFTNALIEIETFVLKVVNGDDPAFVLLERLIERNDLVIVRETLDRLPLATNFIFVIKLFEYFSPEYEYSPRVELFFKCCFKLDLGKEWFLNPLTYTSKQGKRAFALYNDFLDLIRIEYRSAEFDGKISDRQYNSDQNYKSAVDFVEPILSRRQLVLRVDLYYLPEHANNVTLSEAKRDFEHFLYVFRRNKGFTKHLNGYLWKLEFGHQKKLHFHMLFFYDGDYVRNDSYWANRIGCYWRDVITCGRGKFYNGNTKENKYKFERNGWLGIGMINRRHDDPEKDTGKIKRDILLNKILKYMMKSEQFILAKKLSESGFRLFGKGRGYNIRKE